MARTPETDKANVIAFYEMMFDDCEPTKAIAAFAGADYVQHNPYVSDGKHGFISYFERKAAKYPGKWVKVKRAIAEGNHVVLHCHQI